MRRSGGVLVFLLAMGLVFFGFGTGTAGAGSRGIGVVVHTASGGTKKIPLYGDGYYALVVGVSNYQNNAWPKLPNPVKDAKSVARALKSRGWTVKGLYDPDAARLRDALNQLAVGPGQDRGRAILFWFSGHGYTWEQADGSHLGYIVPKDAPDPYKNPAGFLNKAVSMRTLQSISMQILSRHVLMVFDSCFSGAIFRLVRAAPSPFIREQISYPVREFITAGGEKEEVPDHSVFKEVFLQAIDDGFGDVNHDGYVTGQELGSHLQEEVVNYTRGAEHPQFGKINNPKLDKGDFVFQVASSGAQVEGPAIAPVPQKARLSVTSNVTGAVVYMDNTRLGTTPLSETSVAPGHHRIRVAANGYDPYRTEVTIRSGRHVALSAYLTSSQPANGSLYVDTEPGDARIRILNSGLAYSRGMDLAPGRYQVEASKDGYRTRTQWVEVAAGEDKYVTLVLSPAAAGMGATWTDPTTGMAFVKIQGGCFQMGSPASEAGRFDNEGPVHKVCVDSFYMGKTEVTRGQFRKFVEATGYRTDAEKDGTAWVDNADTKWKWKSLPGYSWRKPGFSQDDRHPVVDVSWNDAVAFAKWLSGQTGKEIRLPTEAEWEYAARGGTTEARFWGNDDSEACTYANVADKGHGWNDSFPCNDGYDFTAPVGNYKPNPFGLYDMLGNVWEWCSDWYNKDYYRNSPRENPQGPSTGSYRVLRGGSWNVRPRSVRSAARGRYTPGDRLGNLGFRLALPARSP